MISELTETLENICFILGNDKIKKMSYNDQLEYMIKGLNRFFNDYDIEIKSKAYILTLFQNQIKKKYPKLSKKQSMDLAIKLFTERKVSTKKNEDIKKHVLDEARKSFAKILAKVAEKSQTTKDELHISNKNSELTIRAYEHGKFIFAVIVLAIVFILVLLSAK